MNIKAKSITAKELGEYSKLSTRVGFEVLTAVVMKSSIFWWSRYSYGLGGPGSIPGVETDYEAHPASYPKSTGGSFPRG
jgi:hypothetical protein